MNKNILKRNRKPPPPRKTISNERDKNSKRNRDSDDLYKNEKVAYS